MTLAVDSLSVTFRTSGGLVRALAGVGVRRRGRRDAGLGGRERVGQVGHGLCPARLAGLGLLGAAGQVTAGRAMLEGVDLVRASPRMLARIRGRRAAMILQNPRAAPNPIRSAGRQIADVLRRHAGLGARAARNGAIDMLRQVGIPDPVRHAGAYPFQLSGGMCRRVMIAVAVAAKPALLIADEPTTGLDVTTQALVMGLRAPIAPSSPAVAVR